MPHPIPSLSPKEVAAQLVGAPERRDAIDVVADAYNVVMSDPVVRASHDAAKYILAALEEAGHRPSRRASKSYDFHGARELDWGEIEGAIHAIDTIGAKVEMIGRCAVDNVHSEDLTDVFGSVRVEIQEQVEHLKSQLGLSKEAQS